MVAACLLSLVLAQAAPAETVTAIVFVNGRAIDGGREAPLAGITGAQLEALLAQGTAAKRELTVTVRARSVRDAFRQAERGAAVDLLVKRYLIRDEGPLDVKDLRIAGVRPVRFAATDEGERIDLRFDAAFQRVRVLGIVREFGRPLTLARTPLKTPRGEAFEVRELRSADVLPGITPPADFGNRAIEFALVLDEDEAVKHFETARRRGRPVDVEFLFFPDGEIRPYFEFLRVRVREASPLSAVAEGASTVVRFRGARAEAEAVKG